MPQARTNLERIEFQCMVEKDIRYQQQLYGFSDSATLQILVLVLANRAIAAGAERDALIRHICTILPP